MPTIDITRPELIWPGKYDENGNRIENRGVALPFQIIETIREGRATREPGRTGDLFSYAAKQDESNWHNKLIWGDNLLVLASLMEEYAGNVDLIYIDPPFATGADFSFVADIGEDSIPLTKEQSAIEEKAYRDTWGKGVDSYLNMMVPRLQLARHLLANDGMFFLHCDWHIGHHLRVLLDEVFGSDNFVSQIIWQKIRSSKGQSRAFGNVHDLIYVYAASDATTFAPQYIPLDEARIKQHYSNVEPDTGRRYMLDNFAQAGQGEPRQFGDKVLHPPPGKHWIWSQDKIDEGIWTGRIVITSGGTPRVKRYLDESKGNPLEDIWTDIPPINSQSRERVNYSTQKPEALLRRIIGSTPKENALVMDVFMGSGTTLAVAENMGHRWIGCDLGRFAIHTTRKRMLEIPDCKPFEVLNLGKYERSYWQGVRFGTEPREPNQAAIAAYIAFILELYKAQPLAGTHIHGKKSRALVHVGAVDAPVTISQVNETLAECAALVQRELHILGWEWEMGMNDPIIKHAQSEYGIGLRLLNIPREVMEKRAVECGDIRFFDLAYLEAELKPEGKGKQGVRVELKNFVIPDTDLIPDEVRAKITKWSDYIDYWAVDWDFRHDTFMNQWQTYRTRTQRKLELVSDPNTYKEAGVYSILIKVVDIFGNDTNRLLQWEVK